MLRNLRYSLRQPNNLCRGQYDKQFDKTKKWEPMS